MKFLNICSYTAPLFVPNYAERSYIAEAVTR